MSRCLPEVSLKLGLLPVQFILIILLLSLVVAAYYVTRFDFSVEIVEDVCSEFILIYKHYTVMNFQEGTAEMEEKVPRDLEDLRDQKVILINVNVAKIFWVT